MTVNIKYGQVLVRQSMGFDANGYIYSPGF